MRDNDPPPAFAASFYDRAGSMRSKTDSTQSSAIMNAIGKMLFTIKLKEVCSILEVLSKCLYSSYFN